MKFIGHEDVAYIKRRDRYSRTTVESKKMEHAVHVYRWCTFPKYSIIVTYWTFVILIPFSLPAQLRFASLLLRKNKSQVDKKRRDDAAGGNTMQNGKMEYPWRAVTIKVLFAFFIKFLLQRREKSFTSITGFSSSCPLINFYTHMFLKNSLYCSYSVVVFFWEWPSKQKSSMSSSFFFILIVECTP